MLFLFDYGATPSLRYRSIFAMDGKECTMNSFKKKVEETTGFVRSRIAEGLQPPVGLLAGTGLGEAFREMDVTTTLDYEEIPGFPVSTVQGHSGRFLFGELAGVTVVAMQGRFHYYEGYGMKEVTLPIRVMQLLGVRTLLFANAAGGINPLFAVGDIMVVADHINLTGNNPLVGPNVEEWGPRFPDMTTAYDPKLIASVEAVALGKGVGLRKGVYVGLGGPSLETPSEIRFLRTIGGDAVGLSTVPEVIVAVHGGMQVLGLSVITNMNFPDNPVSCNVDEIIGVARGATPRLAVLFKGVLEALSNEAG